MPALVTVAAALVAVAAAARSTWSPCGVSMLATVTPLAERGRGHRYRSTAAWFIAGGTAGGATLGLVMAALALGVRAADPSAVALATAACAVAVLAAASDTRFAGFRLPFHSRQVNERWLDQFRPWVYGAGFGWQIGAGLVTYIRTAALYLMIALAALTAKPATALAIGALFGLVRGLAVLLGRGIVSPASLADFHRRFTRAGPAVLGVVVACELTVALVFAAVLSPWVALALVLCSAPRRRGGRPAAPAHAGRGPDLLLAAHVHRVDTDGDDPHDDAAIAGRVVLPQVGVVLGTDLLGEGPVAVRGDDGGAPDLQVAIRVLQVEQEHRAGRLGLDVLHLLAPRVQ